MMIALTPLTTVVAYSDVEKRGHASFQRSPSSARAGRAPRSAAASASVPSVRCTRVRCRSDASVTVFHGP